MHLDYKEDHLNGTLLLYLPNQQKILNCHLARTEPDPSEPLLPDPIATNLRFAGMPEKRWWNFEDSYIDFGSINPKKNNITSILLMEFALVYSPDWFIIPYQMTDRNY